MKNLTNSKSSWLKLFVGMLATWRLTSFISHQEAGPYGIFNKLRQAAGVWHDTRGQAHARTELAKGMLCFWCCSVWFGTLVSLLQGVFNPLLALAYSAGAILLDEVSQ